MELGLVLVLALVLGHDLDTQLVHLELFWKGLVVDESVDEHLGNYSLDKIPLCSRNDLALGARLDKQLFFLPI
jgi:hypothetical protein